MVPQCFPQSKMAACFETTRMNEVDIGDNLTVLTMNSSKCSSEVELGFVEDNAKPWMLLSRHFPCKVGGKPAWLNLKNLPDPSDLHCKVCDGPMIFLLQIYAPVDGFESCFHRTIFVFFCKNPHCCRTNCADNFVVFRCQLPRKNNFYSYETPVDYEGDTSGSGPSAADFCNLCQICGCLGPKRCSRCTAAYCSVQHQRVDWKYGHKSICKDGVDLPKIPNTNKISNYLLPEFEIVIEPEEQDDDVVKCKQEERAEEERLNDYKDFVEKQKDSNDDFSSGNLCDEDLKDLQNIANTKVDKQFQKFRRRLECDPDQVLRYQRGGTPLWICSENIPRTEEIPNCLCGATRQFEFQILPQLLIHLKLDDTQQSVDWGTLVIYSCSKNCEPKSNAYQREFILKQDISQKEAECKKTEN